MPFLSSWLFYALLSAIFAALTNIFLKVGVRDVNSNMATWIRVVVLVVVLTPILPLLKQWVPPTEISRRTWIYLVLSGLAGGASWMAYHHALKLGDISLVGPVDKLSVALVILLGVGFLGEHLSGRQWLGVAMLVAGVLVIAWPTAKAGTTPTAATPAALTPAPTGGIPAPAPTEAPPL